MISLPQVDQKHICQENHIVMVTIWVLELGNLYLRLHSGTILVGSRGWGEEGIERGGRREENGWGGG